MEALAFFKGVEWVEKSMTFTFYMGCQAEQNLLEIPKALQGRGTLRVS